ncbi:MAG: DUF4097 family beta strand repeat protein [Actinobacteria bacterium]|nr:DUF4097 family beta strand repeat protein [Actinomycetota bacterium]
MPQHAFDTAGPLEIVVEIGLGRVELVCAETARTEVTVEPTRPDPEAQALAEQVTVELDGSRLQVRSPRRWWSPAPRLTVTITAPEGSRLATRAAVADVTCRGPLGELSVNTASGDVTAEAVTGDVTVNLANGDVRLATVGGRLRARRANGRLTVASASEVEVDTANGDTSIGEVTGRVRARTASGDVEIGEVSRGEVTVQTMSGNVRVQVRPGTGVRLDLASHSGDVRSDLAVDDAPPVGGVPLELHLRTMTGNIRVGRSAATPAR